MLSRPLIRFRRLRVALLVVAAAALAAPAGAQAVTVYGAASLRTAFPAIDERRRTTSPAPTRCSSRSSAARRADVFASAGPKEAQALFREGRCARPVTFATNILVLLVRRAATRPTCAPSTRCARAAGGSPSAPPACRSATTRASCCAACSLTSILQREHRQPGAERRRASPPRSALGSADAGFVYYTDALSARGRASEIRLPAWAQPPCALPDVRRQARRRGHRRGAKAFIAQVRSDRRPARPGALRLRPAAARVDADASAAPAFERALLAPGRAGHRASRSWRSRSSRCSREVPLGRVPDLLARPGGARRDRRDAPDERGRQRR